eukprot:gnl/Hemi2/1610_TR575_c0_g1_i1.p1 gnl/Hemi2/1610_TR575_c0_g1~~gnl/Hemi2/1610_TR575_c0_g1_i1.p1  ORF type:complete len:600 (-),score=176.59 gnl/Hemi2/1610_TR575_c0_g1_i1:120-1919(-)
MSDGKATPTAKGKAKAAAAAAAPAAAAAASPAKKKRPVSVDKQKLKDQKNWAASDPDEYQGLGANGKQSSRASVSISDSGDSSGKRASTTINKKDLRDALREIKEVQLVKAMDSGMVPVELAGQLDPKAKAGGNQATAHALLAAAEAQGAKQQSTDYDYETATEDRTKLTGVKRGTRKIELPKLKPKLATAEKDSKELQPILGKDRPDLADAAMRRSARCGWASWASWLRSYNMMDLFGYNPGSRFAKYRSWFGATATLVVLILCLCNITYTCNQFFFLDDATSEYVTETSSLPAVSDTTSGASVYQSLRLQLPKVAFSLRDSNGVEQTAPVGFSVSVSQVVKYRIGGVVTATSTPLTTSSCTFTSGQGRTFTASTCLSSGAYILGSQYDSIEAYVNVQMSYTTLTGTQATFDAAFSAYTMYVISDDSTDRGSNFRESYRNLMHGAMSTDSFYWQRVNVTRYSRFIFIATTPTPYTVYETASAGLEDIVDTAAGTYTYCNWNLRFSPREKIVSRNPPGLFPMLATWGGLICLLWVAIGGMASRWNESAFEAMMAGRSIATMTPFSFTADGRLRIRDSASMPEEFRSLSATDDQFINDFV